MEEVDAEMRGEPVPPKTEAEGWDLLVASELWFPVAPLLRVSMPLTVVFFVVFSVTYTQDGQFVTVGGPYLSCPERRRLGGAPAWSFYRF